MRSFIEVEALAGLANRLRVINAAYWLARDVEKDLRVTWTPYKGLNCRFSDLFQPPEEFEVREQSATPFHENRFYKFYFGLKALRYDRAINLLDEDKIRPEEFAKEALASFDRVFLASVHDFYPGDRPFFGFRPVPKLDEQIKEMTGNFSPDTIGIHIRRTDNVHSINRSKTSVFISLMEDKVARNPKTSFFLSTDSKAEELTLREVFGDKIMATKKVLSRNSREGIEDALIDMFCLGHTSEIIGSYFSSFSEVAARIHEIPLLVAG